MSSDHGANENPFDPTEMSSKGDTLRAALDRLSTSESGLGFIYSVLALLVERFDLLDAVIVLEDQSAGTQIFRFGGRAVSRSFAAQLGVVPGVYCEPRVVVADDLELVRFACQRELSLHQARLLSASEPRVFVEEHRDDVAVPHVAVTRIVENAERLNVIAQDVTRAFVDRSRARTLRETLSAFLAFVDAMTLILTVANIHGPMRFFLGLILGIFIPGWSLVGLIKLRNAALEVGLTMSTSLAYVMLAAQILITAGLWHPIVLEEFTCVVCLPSLLWQSGMRLRRLGFVK